MATLKNLRIDEVSLVDAGANPEANIVLFKRKSTDVTATCQKLIDTLTVQIDKLKTDEFRKIAERYEILGQNADELAPLLKSAEAQDNSLYNKLIGVLDSALEATRQAGTFEEVGKRGDGLKSNDIQKIAASIRQQNPTLTFRQALDAAYLQHPELQ